MIDPRLLQMLGVMGGIESTPVSGIGGGTPLSGLMLGEQGMGMGGGGGMLSGQGGGGGGLEMGGGGDLSQLLSLLQGAGSAEGVGLGGGAPTLGQSGGGSLGAGFGAGGQLQQQQMGVPQGTMTAGLGGGINMAQILSLAKTIGKSFLPTGSVSAPSIGETTLPAVGGAFAEPAGTTLEQMQAAEPGFFSLTGEGSGGPLDTKRFSLGVSPNFNIGSIGAGTVQAFPGAPPAGQIMEGVGGGGAAPGGGLGFNLPTIGGLTGIGTGALELAGGNPVGGADLAAGIGSLAFPPAAPLFGAFSLLSHLLGVGEDRPSTFKPTREAAARAGEFDISTRQQLIDRALQAHDPALVLQALQWSSVDNPWPGVSGISESGVPRNPVRTDIGMSPEIARMLGFDPAQDIQRYLGETRTRHGVETPTHRYSLRGGPGWDMWSDIPGFANIPPDVRERMTMRGRGPSPTPPAYGLYLQGSGHMGEGIPGNLLGPGTPGSWVPGPWERQPGTVNPAGTTYTPDVFSPGWGGFNPSQFNQFLSMYKKDPTQFNITGSGDVAYLQQGPAEALAARARQQTMDLLSQLTQWPQFA